MPRRPNNLETVMMTIHLLKLLPVYPRMKTIAELERDLKEAGFDRGKRTVQRQMNELTNRFDIHCDTRSSTHGFAWSRNAKGFSIPGLSEQESLLLLLAREHLARLLPVKLMSTMQPFFDQAASNLSRSGNDVQAREWLKKVRVVSRSQPLIPPTIDDIVFSEVSNALFANRWLSIEYRNRDGDVTKGRVMPLGLAQQGEQLYLVCRFDGYDNERSLALHRFISAKAGTQSFDRPEGFDLARYDESGRFGYGEGKKIRLSFKIRHEAGLHLLEAKLSADQTHEVLPEHFAIQATVVDSAQLKWWLQSFGEDVVEVRREAVTEDALANNP